MQKKYGSHLEVIFFSMTYPSAQQMPTSWIERFFVSACTLLLWQWVCEAQDSLESLTVY